MILDQQLVLSDAQEVTVTAVSTNTIDLGANGTDALGNAIPSDAGAGKVPQLVVQVDSAFDAAGAATMEVEVITSDADDLGSPTVIIQTEPIGKAALVAGYQFKLSHLPPGLTKRYLGVRYTVATGPMTEGAVSAFLVIDAKRV